MGEQTILRVGGSLAAIVGAILLWMSLAQRSRAGDEVSTGTLALCLAAVFVVLAGSAASMAAWQMKAMAKPMTRVEQNVLRVIAAFCVLVGIFVVARAADFFSDKMPTVNDLYSGVIGATALLAGIQFAITERTIAYLAARSGNSPASEQAKRTTGGA